MHLSFVKWRGVCVTSRSTMRQKDNFSIDAIELRLHNQATVSTKGKPGRVQTIGKSDSDRIRKIWFLTLTVRIA